MITAIKKFSVGLTKVLKIIMAIMLGWMTVALTIQVVARYIFLKSFVWSEESARYIMIWMILIGTAEVILNSEHIKVTVLEDLLGRKAKKYLGFVQDIIFLIFTVIICWFSFPQVKLASLAVSSNMNINMGIVYVIFPIATILMIIAFIIKIILFFADKKPEAGSGEVQK